jgi:phosphatidylcholine synthase
MTVLAWLVHLYTAMGLVCAAGMAVLIVRGGDASFRGAFLLMMVATAIDATDGWLARKARVKEVLPGFDGGALDNLIDFQTYARCRCCCCGAPGRCRATSRAAAAAAAYGFSRSTSRPPTASSSASVLLEHRRVLSVRAGAPVWVVALIVACAVLTFVPTPYIYATRGGPLHADQRRLRGLVRLAGLVLYGPEDIAARRIASLAFPVMYMTLSAFVTFTRKR